MSLKWHHNGSVGKYAIDCFCYSSMGEAWQAIKRWHEQSIPYNLVYVAGSVYAFPRQGQNSIRHSNWTSGFSWVEAAGEMVIQDQTSFITLGETDIEDELRKILFS